MDDYLGTLKQRRNWLTERIEAKKRVGWEIVWDTQERDALSWAIEKIDSDSTPATMEISCELHSEDLAL